MTPRDILLKAADHIERNPESYRFSKVFMPSWRKPTGCMIGWMAHYAGHWSWFGRAQAGDKRCKKILGINSSEFFSRLYKVPNNMTWASNPFDAVRAMRSYANVYHPDPGYAGFRSALDLSPLAEKDKVCGGKVT